MPAYALYGILTLYPPPVATGPNTTKSSDDKEDGSVLYIVIAVRHTLTWVLRRGPVFRLCSVCV